MHEFHYTFRDLEGMSAAQFTFLIEGLNKQRKEEQRASRSGNKMPRRGRRR